MSGQRFAFYGLFEPREAGRPSHRPLEQGPFDVKRHRRQVITVPAGKTRLAILDDKPVTAATDARFLGLHSTVEGVQWWPIDSATPSIDQDTDLFGYLFDNSAPDYEHNHSAISSDQTVDHGTTPVAAYHNNIFPSFQSNKLDRTSVSATNRMFSDTEAVAQPEPRVGTGGNAIDITRPVCVPPVGSGGMLVHQMYGQDSYKNLGTLGDGLEFQVVVYYADGSKFTKVYLAFHCYPYTASALLLTGIPTTTPQGKTVWATDDYNIDRMSTHGGLIIGWDPFGVPLTGASIRLIPTNGPISNGWNVIRMTKAASYANHSADTLVSPALGAGTFQRVTMLTAQVTDTGSAVEGYLANVYFGPRPGLLRVLRPYELTGDEPWGAASIPAIGIQNPTSASADVEVVYGGL